MSLDTKEFPKELNKLFITRFNFFNYKKGFFKMSNILDSVTKVESNQIYLCYSYLNMNDKEIQQRILPGLIEFDRIDVLENMEFDVNMKLKDGETCLFFAKTVRMFLYLLHRGADVLHTNNDGELCLNIFMQDIDDDKIIAEILKHCLKLGVDINHVNRFGRNILWDFMMRAEAKTESFLLLSQNGVKVDQRDDKGYCITSYFLQEFADLKNCDVFMWIILAGADWRPCSALVRGHCCYYICYSMCCYITEETNKIIDNTYDEHLERKTAMQENNLVDFKNYGTNFFTLPYIQILDALHMLLYGTYKSTHPLYNETKIEGFLDDVEEADKEACENDLKYLQHRLYLQMCALKKSKLGQETKNRDYESVQKKLKINSTHEM